MAIAGGDMSYLRHVPMALLGPATFWPASAADAPAPPVLSLPIACQPGRDCFIQQYMDHDPGPGATDYRCGSRVYDGHKGLDIRLPSIAAQQRGVDVLAAADGVVEGLRDGEPDRLVSTTADRDAVSGRECGNGVLIDHGGGWRTQYCHMAKGSIAVTVGQAVRAGDRLGQLGLSGETQFPHLHLSLRHGDRRVDPFAPDLAPGACGEGGGKSMWSPEAAKALAYRSSEVINMGFATGPVSMAAIDAESPTRPDRDAPALVFYTRLIGAEAGDRLILRLLDPQGGVLAESDGKPLDRDKAQLMGYAGYRRTAEGWPRGTYRGTLTLERDGQPVLQRALELEL